LLPKAPELWQWSLDWCVIESCSLKLTSKLRWIVLALFV
jgi:hypothetical protein